MTDKEKFEALMKEFDVPLQAMTYDVRPGEDFLVIEAQMGPKVGGYAGFVADWVFDAQTGKFLRMGVWE